MPFHGEFGYRKTMPDGQSEMPQSKMPGCNSVSYNGLSACLAERGHDGSRGLQPTVQAEMDRVAEQRLNWSDRRGGLGSSVAPRREIFPPKNRGLKPTATVSESLRDCKTRETAVRFWTAVASPTRHRFRNGRRRTKAAWRFASRRSPKCWREFRSPFQLTASIKSNHESAYHLRSDSV